MLLNIYHHACGYGYGCERLSPSLVKSGLCVQVRHADDDCIMSWGTQPMGCTLSRRGYGIPLSQYTDTDTIDRLRDILTVTPSPRLGQAAPSVVSFPVFLENRSMIYIPRVFGLDAFGQPPAPLLDLQQGAIAPALTNFVGQLRSTQQRAVEAFMEAVNDPGRRGGLLSLPCGAGKTVVALFLMSLIARRTLVVAAKDFLLNQWSERITEFLPDASVGYLRAQTCDMTGRDVVLVSLQSLALKPYHPDMFRPFDLCVFDECHHLGAEVFSRAMSKVATPILLGLSATLDRKDGLRRVFEWFLGPVVYEVTQQARSNLVVKTLSFPCPDAPDPVSGYGAERIIYGGRVNLARMVSELCSHKPRTDAILDALLICVDRDPGRRVLILTDRRSHVVELESGLVARGVSCSNVGSYVGGMKATALKASESCQYILGTFAMAAEGFDVQALDTLVLASPATSIEQAIGRIGRSIPDLQKHVPLVIDVLDNFSIFRNQANKRRRFYRSRGYASVMM